MLALGTIMNFWGINHIKRLLQTGVTLVLLVALSIGLSGAAGRPSSMPAGNAITDGKILLRNALPFDNATMRELQRNLEDISVQLRANRRWGAVSGDVSKASRIVSDRTAAILASIPDAQKAEAEARLAQIKDGLVSLQASVEAKDKQATLTTRGQLLDIVTLLEEAMVQEFPFTVPDAYSHLPQLKGHATVEFKFEKGTITAVVDGYSAPVTAGNFVDLVKRGFYNGLPFIRAEDFYVLQIGDPAGPEDGFIDPKTKQYRTVPLEVLVEGDTEPTYGITLEDAGRYKDLPVLPFSSYGALAMARPGEDANGGSSQFFFFLFEPELTPAGLNLLDGRYSVFGYVVAGKDVLEQLKEGDKIISATVTKGLENLQQPKA
jgi:peptidylprolyl isomerase